MDNRSDTPAPKGRNLRIGRHSQPGRSYLITAATCKRQPFFAVFPVAVVAARCFDDPELLAGNCMLAWVLMPDHAHWLVRLGENGDLARLVARLKSASARAANRVHGRNGVIWQHGYHDHALRHDEDMRSAARYLIANPVRAGVAEEVGDYPFWNAVWL